MNDQSQMLNQHQMHMVNQQQQQQQPPLMGPTHSQSNIQYPPWSLHSFPPPLSSNPHFFPKPTRSHWKGKKPLDIINKDLHRRKSHKTINSSSSSAGAATAAYQPPPLYELEHQNRLKARRFYHPKKNKFNRMAPYAHAPRNTTSFLIRAKKSGGIASLVSPCPVTPAVLPTPVFSPSREALVDMAKEEWGVDGYGSMKGFIRLRSPGHDDDYDDDYEGGSSESDVEEHLEIDRRLDHDVEEHVEVEKRLDHDLSRFEMIYPNPNTGVDYHNVLENRVDDQDTHIAHLEDENLILKERLYLMERELGELRRRLLCLERHNQVVEDINEEVVENDSHDGLTNKHNEEVDYVPRDDVGESDIKSDDGEDMLHKGLSQLVVKDASEGNTALGEGEQDVSLVNNNEHHSVDSMVNNEQVEGLYVEQNQEESDKKNVGLVDGGGTQVPNVDDVCMGQTINKQGSECDQPQDLDMETDKDDEAGASVQAIAATYV